MSFDPANLVDAVQNGMLPGCTLLLSEDDFERLGIWLALSPIGPKKYAHGRIVLYGHDCSVIVEREEKLSSVFTPGIWVYDEPPEACDKVAEKLLSIPCACGNPASHVPNGIHCWRPV